MAMQATFSVQLKASKQEDGSGAVVHVVDCLPALYTQCMTFPRLNPTTCRQLASLGPRWTIIVNGIAIEDLLLGSWKPRSLFYC